MPCIALREIEFGESARDPSPNGERASGFMSVDLPNQPPPTEQLYRYTTSDGACAIWRAAGALESTLDSGAAADFAESIAATEVDEGEGRVPLFAHEAGGAYAPLPSDDEGGGEEDVDAVPLLPHERAGFGVVAGGADAASLSDGEGDGEEDADAAPLLPHERAAFGTAAAGVDDEEAVEAAARRGTDAAAAAAETTARIQSCSLDEGIRESHVFRSTDSACLGVRNGAACPSSPERERGEEKEGKSAAGPSATSSAASARACPDKQSSASSTSSRTEAEEKRSGSVSAASDQLAPRHALPGSPAASPPLPRDTFAVDTSRFPNPFLDTPRGRNARLQHPADYKLPTPRVLPYPNLRSRSPSPTPPRRHQTRDPAYAHGRSHHHAQHLACSRARRMPYVYHPSGLPRPGPMGNGTGMLRRLQEQTRARFGYEAMTKLEFECLLCRRGRVEGVPRVLEGGSTVCEGCWRGFAGSEEEVEEEKEKESEEQGNEEGRLGRCAAPDIWLPVGEGVCTMRGGRL
ncbi:hypothetical protein LTR53_002044 [Teratosphaeriaceae sp. CCFEE 6253]|nr:hypothetical protein LTR53_002044 [Teratosphaeriaceae sp. CCFEE 6253]